MNLLIIMEGYESPKPPASFFNEMKADTVYLLYLSPSVKAYQYKEELLSGINRELKIEIIKREDFADFGHIRNALLDFIASIPERLKVGNSNLSDYLIIHGLNMWWSSGIVEATPYKHNLLQNLYYLSVVSGVLKRIEVNVAWFSLEDKSLKKDMVTLFNDRAVKYYQYSGSKWISGIIHYIIRFKTWLLYFISHLTYSIVFKAMCPSRIMPRQSKDGKKNIHLFYSYYPYSLFFSKDIPKAKVYADIPSVLSKRLNGEAYYLCNISPVSLLNPLRLLKDARKFWAHNFRFIPMDIYVSIWDMFKIFLSPLRYWKYFCLKKSSAYRKSFKIEGIDMFHTFDGVMKNSLVGNDAWNNLLHYHAFKKFTRLFGKSIFQVIYYVEMHSWEAALVSAVKDGDSSIPVLGLQQSAPNPILLSFYFSPAMFKDARDAYPFPDLMLCAGQLYKELFIAGGIAPKRLEVIGHFSGQNLNRLSISTELKRQKLKAMGLPLDKKVCLVACCVNFSITESMVYFISRVVKELADVFFIIKGHPDYPLEPLLRKYGMNNMKNLISSQDAIPNLLVLCDCFLSTSTTVSPEALCLGIPQANLDGWGLPFANPLHFIPGLISDIQTPEQLLDFFSNTEKYRIPKEKCYPFIGGQEIDPCQKFLDIVVSKFHNAVSNI